MEWSILWVRCTLCHRGDCISRQWSGLCCGWGVRYAVIILVLADKGVAYVVGGCTLCHCGDSIS